LVPARGRRTAGVYQYAVHGGAGAYTAELELVPYCYGLRGVDPSATVEVLRRNLPMFIADSARAKLVEVVQSSN